MAVPAESRDFCFAEISAISYSSIQENPMEFVEFAMLAAAVLLMIFKPEQERLAWLLTIIGWAVVVFMYIGHVSTSILGVLNI